MASAFYLANIAIAQTEQMIMQTERQKVLAERQDRADRIADQDSKVCEIIPKENGMIGLSCHNTISGSGCYVQFKSMDAYLLSMEVHNNQGTHPCRNI